MEFNEISKPSHYNSCPSGMQPRQFYSIVNGHLASVIKYVWRAGLKEGNPKEKDINKAIQYLRFAIADLNEFERPLYLSKKDFMNLVFEAIESPMYSWEKGFFKTMATLLICDSINQEIEAIEGVIEYLEGAK